jgi:tRNA splicing endonuclease
MQNKGMIEGILKAASVLVPSQEEEEFGSNCFEVHGVSYSVLLDEEAAHSLELGLLKVSNDDGTNVELSDLWSLFCSKCKHFPLKYAVYKYFRERGYNFAFFVSC